VETFISQLKARQDQLSKLKLDVLRALIAFGGAIWFSELLDAINRLHLGEASPVDQRELLKAVEELEKQNLVKAERKIRASDKSGGVKDILITLLSEEVRLSLSSDEVLNKYYLSLSEIFEKS